jgi:hypothetical protein
MSNPRASHAGPIPAHSGAGAHLGRVVTGQYPQVELNVESQRASRN